MNTRLAVRIALAIAAVPAALILPQPQALAQDAAQAGAVEEIVVTARRRAENLNDVPIAVSVYSAEQLAATGSADITTLQRTTPNLTLQVARGSNSTLIAFIRGVGQQDPLWGFEPGVGLYVDDVYVARPQGAVLDIYDIKDIEVLRGPQGTLYGRNTIGGAIKYVTAPIADHPRFNAQVNLGNYQQTDGIVSGSAPIGEHFAVGGAVAIYRHDGYGTNHTTGAEEYNKDVDAFRGTVEWKPADGFLFRLSGDYLDDKSNARHGHREAPGSGLSTGQAVLSNVYDNNAGIGDDNSVKAKGVSLLGQWDVSDTLTLKSITAYREGDTDTLIDFDAGPSAALDVPAFYDDNQLSQEVQLLWTGSRVQAVAGLFYLDGAASGAFDTILGIANLTIATSGRVKTISKAAFADVSFDITDRWSVSLGGRYTQDDKTGSVYRQNFTGIRSPLFGNAAAVPGLLRTNYANSRSFSEFTPRASVRFKPADDLMLYASYGRGFKSGGFDMRGDAFAFPGTVDGYDPEVVDTYELGFKTTTAGGNLRLAGALFYSKYKDQQITSQFALATVPPTIVSFVDNAASSTIKGAELEANISFNESVSARAQLGYIDAGFDEFVTYNPATGTRDNLADQRDFQNTPKFVGSVSLTWHHDLAGRGDLAFTPAVAYRSSFQMFEAATPLLDQDAYTLVDASIVWTLPSRHFTLGLHGKNLTDEEYRVGGYSFPGATFGNSINAFYGPPRTYTLSANYRFD
ncbi:MAG: TonB-dependent receptor [Steroidobacteraceae bacterium]